MITLLAEDRAVLEERARACTAPSARVVRAKIVLLAADGAQNIDIAARLDVDVDVVSRWRKRFYEQGVRGLVGRPRSGRPPRFSPLVLAEVKAAACELPAASDTACCPPGDHPHHQRGDLHPSVRPFVGRHREVLLGQVTEPRGKGECDDWDQSSRGHGIRIVEHR